jgi:hypothetical protein
VLAPHISRRSAETEAVIGAAKPTQMDFDALMAPNGFSAINILPKGFNQHHRVVEFNVEDSHGGCECKIRGFIARSYVETKAQANSTGIIVGTSHDSSEGDVLLFRPFFGCKQEIHKVRVSVHGIA